jgi:hypothetical protein
VQIRNPESIFCIRIHMLHGWLHCLNTWSYYLPILHFWLIQHINPHEFFWMRNPCYWFMKFVEVNIGVCWRKVKRNLKIACY